MASIGDTTRPEYIYDQATDTWIPVGIGPHAHTPAAIGAIASSIVTTKGDIIAATGSGLVVRQGVGADGSYLMADSSQADGLSYASGNNLAAGKNGIINGGFDIWQRGTTNVLASFSAFTTDRWLMNYSGKNTGLTTSRQPTGDTTNLPNIQYCARVQRNSGETSTAGISLSQSIETANSIPFVGKPVTLSLYARRGANFSAASSAFKVALYGGTGTDQNVVSGYTGFNVVIDQSVTLTTTWQRFQFTTTVNSANTELSAYFEYIPSGTAGANDYFEITGVQLEHGSVATPFARVGGTIQGELAACQRYYNRFNSDDGSLAMFNFKGNFYAASNWFGYFDFPVTMRVAPQAVEFSAVGNFLVDDLTASYTMTGIATNTARNTKKLGYIFGSASGGAIYRPAYMFANSTQAAYIGWSAEL